MPRLTIIPLLLACASIVPAKSFVAERYDVRVRVLPDASLLVTENVRFLFREGRFSYVSREVSKQGTDRIFDVNTAMDGMPAKADVQETGGLVKVVWHFDAPADSSHEFKLTYRVAGAIRQEPDRDRLLWHAIPDRHDYTILAGEVEVECPPEAALFGPPEVPHALSGRREGSRSVFALPELAPDHGVPVWVEFRSGFVAEPPRWQADEAARGQRVKTAWMAGILAFFVASAAGVAWLMRARDSIPANAEIGLHGAEERGVAPGLPPAVAARLAGQELPVYASMGTLFDLARRGIVAIREGKRRRLGGKVYTIEPGNLALSLLPFERELLKLAFGEERPARPREFSSFVNKVSASGSTVSKLVEQHMISLGFLDPERIAVRKKWLASSLLSMLGGLLVAALGGVLCVNAVTASDPQAVWLAAITAGIGAAVFLVAIAGLIVSLGISTLSAQGAIHAGPWRREKADLAAMTRQSSAVSAADFEPRLPFAMALGLGAAWVKRFRKQGEIPPPAWFAGDGSGLEYLAFIDFMSHSSASADASSSGGDGGGGGSGGGSSSAG